MLHFLFLTLLEEALEKMDISPEEKRSWKERISQFSQPVAQALLSTVLSNWALQFLSGAAFPLRLG